MDIDLESLQRLAFDALPVLLDAAVKGAVLLAVAGVLVLAMRKASAAARQVVWLLALAALVALPLASAALPSWGILPGWARIEMQAEPVPANVADSVIVEPRADPVGGADRADMQAAPPAPHAHAGESESPPAPIVALEPAPQAMPAPAAAASTAKPAAGQSCGMWIVPSAVATWLAGTLVCLLPLVLGRLSLCRLARRSRQITSGTWAMLLQRAAKAVGLRRGVQLLQSDAEPMPMVWGVLRPRLLIPAEAEDWSADRRWVVLLHELAHTRRHDCLAKLVAHVACSLYWFNPLCWIAFKLMQREAETACDDLVLSADHASTGLAGLRPSDYAQHLLEIASGLKSGMLAAYSSIAMARPSKLEGRLLAILDPRRNRRSLTRLGILIAAVLVAAVAVPLAVLKATGPEKAAVTELADAKRIAALIEQLGSSKFGDRQAAQQALVKIGPPAIELLKTHGPDQSPEITARAAAVLKIIGKPVEEMIEEAKTTSASSEQVTKMDRIIAQYPGYPALPTLRLYRLRALKGLSSEAGHIRSAIKEYEQFEKDSNVDQEISYAAKHDVGYLLYTYLKDPNAAYKHYKEMEIHPWLDGTGLQYDYRKVELYTRIAESALWCRKLDEVDKYARLVLAYPHLGMADRKMYREFDKLYDEAANIFLLGCRHDAKKLLSVEIYPSHEALYKERQRLINAAPGVAPAGSLPPELAASLPATQPGADTTEGQPPRVSVTGRVLGPDGKPVAAARVRLSFRTQPLNWEDDTTDAQGAFKFDRHPSDTWGMAYVAVMAKGFAPALQGLELVPGTPEIVVRLQKGNTIFGRVIDSAGRPVAGAEVTGTGPWYTNGDNFLIGKTDTKGCFRWTEAPETPVPIWAFKHGYEDGDRLIVTPTGREVVLVLTGKVSVQGDFVFDKPVDVKAKLLHPPIPHMQKPAFDVMLAGKLTFTREGAHVQAALAVGYSSWPKATYVATLQLLDSSGKSLASDSASVDASGEILGQALWTQKELVFPLGQEKDLAAAAKWHLTLRIGGSDKLPAAAPATQPSTQPAQEQPADESPLGPAIERDAAAVEGALKWGEDLAVEMKPVTAGTTDTDLRADRVLQTRKLNSKHRYIAVYSDITRT